jgi:signal transduction histidine kinase
MSNARRSLLLRYGLAVVATVLATLLRKLLDPVLEDTAPFTAYFVAIMLTAWYGGLGPSLLALVSGALLAAYLFVEPRGSLMIHDLEHQVSLGLYLFVGVVVALLSESLHASRRRVEAASAEKERVQRLLLEQQQHQRELVEADLAKVKEQLVRQTRLAAIGQISASIAHDLRNSLFTISGAAYLLKRSIPEGQSKSTEQAEHIDHEINTINRLISNLMEMARGKESQKSSVNLGEAVHEAFHRVRRAGTRLRMELSEEPFIVAADPVQLGQVLGNLMANAVEAMGEDGEVRVCGRNDGQTQTIVLEDDGPGIPKELRGQVFEPLVSGKPKGTGLGLAICRQIVERHGGTIDLTDSKGPGAAFVIRLPCGAGHPVQ